MGNCKGDNNVNKKIEELTVEDYQLFLEHVNGFVTCDLEGKVTYINQQVCDFCGLNREWCIGRHIKEVFPFSKMMDTIKYNQPMTTEFYFYNGRVSASTRHPLMRDGKMVGCLEYDLFEDMELVESFIEHYINLDDELKYFKEEAQRFRRTKYSIDNIVGYSTKMLDLKEKIRHIARNNSTVLIHGETGTGKELVAHSIHNLSKRRLRNFIKINSAGLPESLAESELFGYEDGAFTGAKKGGKKGKFELADGGTLFIDEVNQMPLTLQPKLLRVLQEKEVERIGGTKSIPVDVRIIAATNQDLKKLIAEEKFREDLFYRLNVVEIRIPPLRERRDDIPHLARQFVETYNGLFGKHIERIDDRTLKRLMDYDWPGNIRELQNTIERSMNYAEGTVLTDEALDFDVFTEKQSVEMLKGYPKPIEEVLMQTERNLIQRTLEMFGGNKTKAAEFLKIPRTLLYQKMKRLGMK